MGCRGIFLGPRCLAVVCKQRFAQEFTQRVGRRIHRVERGLRTTWMFVYMQSLCGGRVVGLGYLYRRRPPPLSASRDKQEVSAYRVCTAGLRSGITGPSCCLVQFAYC